MPKSTKGHNLVCFSFKLLHTKYLSSGTYGFRIEGLSVSHFKSMGANEPQGVANLDPKGMVGRIYVGDHLTLLHTTRVMQKVLSLIGFFSFIPGIF